MDQITQDIAPEPVITPTPVPTPKSPILLVILAVLITSTLFIGGYFGYQYFTSPKTPTVTLPSPTPTPSPVSSAEVESNWKQDATSEGWKTYTNHIRKYSISYPKDWFADTSLAETTLEDPSGAALVISRDNHKITISWPSSYSPNECIFDDQTKAIEPQQVKCSGDFVSFGNHMRRLVNPSSNIWIIYSLQNPDSYVSVPPISYVSPSKYDPKVLVEMDQILSTFKF